MLASLLFLSIIVYNRYLFIFFIYLSNLHFASIRHCTFLLSPVPSVSSSHCYLLLVQVPVREDRKFSALMTNVGYSETVAVGGTERGLIRRSCVSLCRHESEQRYKVNLQTYIYSDHSYLST